jgi:hypothetical protein
MSPYSYVILNGPFYYSHSFPSYYISQSAKSTSCSHQIFLRSNKNLGNLLLEVMLKNKMTNNDFIYIEMDMKNRNIMINQNLKKYI